MMIYVQSTMYSDICPACGNYGELYDLMKETNAGTSLLRTACDACLKNSNLKEGHDGE